MSTWSDSPQPGRSAAWMLAAGVLLMAVGLVLGLFLMLGGGPAEEPDAGVPGALGTSGPSPTASDSRSTPSSAASTPAAPAPGPDAPALVTWGGTGDHLALVVANDTRRQIRWGRVEITALDGDGRIIASSTGRPASKCCTVLGLPPGEEYGLFLDLDRPVSEVADVRVRYAAVRTAPARTARHAVVEVTDPRLHHVPGDTVVEATFTARGEESGYVMGQAFLVDRRDRLVGVMSGRFWCYRDGDQHRVRMQLLQPLSHRTRLGRALAYPIPRGEARFVPPGC